MKPYPILVGADKTIWRKSCKEQSKYADMVVRACAHDEKLLWKILGCENEVPPIPDDADSSAVGGYAYLSYHAPTPELRTQFEVQLEDFNRKREEFGTYNNENK